MIGEVAYKTVTFWNQPSGTGSPIPHYSWQMQIYLFISSLRMTAEGLEKSSLVYNLPKTA